MVFGVVLVRFLSRALAGLGNLITTLEGRRNDPKTESDGGNS